MLYSSSDTGSNHSLGSEPGLEFSTATWVAMCWNQLSFKTMPMFHSLWDVDDITWVEGDGWLAPFLIPSLARYTDENLTSTMVDVPVVTASRLESDIAHWENGLRAFL